MSWATLASLLTLSLTIMVPLFMLCLAYGIEGLPIIDNGTVPVTPTESVTPDAAHSTKQSGSYTEQMDSTASPYWADPEGAVANQPPSLSPVHLTPPSTKCMEVLRWCNQSVKYRSLSGRCNNLWYPEYGTSGQVLTRLLNPVYDGEMMRTRSVHGDLLPNPRVISLLASLVPSAAHTRHNLLFMQMGQFIDHDYSVTTVSKDDNGKTMNCLRCTSWTDPRCAPVPLPHTDPYLPSRFNDTGKRRCLPFTRSVAEVQVNKMGKSVLEQVNMNTAYLDLSQIYGSNKCRGDELRLHSGGMLKSSYSSRLTLRPANQFPDCRSENGMCFFSGDDRANENPGLTVLHFVFHREHNRLSKSLRKMNPHWSDERLYQEARRINIAQYQHSVYMEYVPAVIGFHNSVKRNLLPQTTGFYQCYDDMKNPGVLNEFSTAAFRMGHSSITNTLPLFTAHYQHTATLPLVTNFHNSSLLLNPEMMDSLLRGLLGHAMKPTDLHLENSIFNELFKILPDNFSGQDLTVLNLARGRDHGLAPYTKYLDFCGITTVVSFDDLTKLMSVAAVSALREAYRHVHDIDLFIGGLAEDHVPGGEVGPTFACIIARQFLITKRSDRFWYENKGSGFTYQQLRNIRTASLSRIICNNMDQVEQEVPPRAYMPPHQTKNPLGPCNSLPDIDTSLWQEHSGEEGCYYQGNYPPSSHTPNSLCLHSCQPDGWIKLV